jgi:hypothetical protein
LIGYSTCKADIFYLKLSLVIDNNDISVFLPQKSIVISNVIVNLSLFVIATNLIMQPISFSLEFIIYVI